MDQQPLNTPVRIDTECLYLRLSYADAFAVAAAQEFVGIMLTGDPEYKALEALVPVEWLVERK
jgi:hypothetical protein